MDLLVQTPIFPHHLPLKIITSPFCGEIIYEIPITYNRHSKHGVVIMPDMFWPTGVDYYCFSNWPTIIKTQIYNWVYWFSNCHNLLVFNLTKSWIAARPGSWWASPFISPRAGPLLPQGLAGRDGKITGNWSLEKSGGKLGKIMGKVMGTSKILDFYRGYSIFSGISSRKMVIE